jgi:hypothetical protein
MNVQFWFHCQFSPHPSQYNRDLSQSHEIYECWPSYLTDSVVQCVPRQACSRSPNIKITRIFWNPRVLHDFYPIFSQMNPIHTRPLCFPKISYRGVGSLSPQYYRPRLRSNYIR